MAHVFGIDLGTTYSCISYVDDQGIPVVVNNKEGNSTTPSVVFFESPTSIVVGDVAKDGAVMNPNETVAFVKRMMGVTDVAITYDGKDRSPEEVSSYILRKLTEDAGKELGEEVKNVVITCPAYFGEKERNATMLAGKIAGLNVMDIINEPTAAAICYGVDKEPGKKTILVYDLGGGTFDVTVMNIDEGKITVVCSDGNHELGGKDWDTAIIQHLAKEFVDQTGFSEEFDEYALQDFQIKAEKAKQQLSSREEVPVMLDANGVRARVSLSRQTFDEITATLLQQTIELTDKCIAEAQSKGYEVDEILLVGGSTKMPQVPAAVQAKYGKEPKVFDPNEAVAKGAGIYALTMAINPQPTNPAKPDETPVIEGEVSIPAIAGEKYKKVEIIAATTKSYGLEVITNGKSQINNLILKNEQMPDGSVSITKTYGTQVDNQTSARLVVYQSDIAEDYYDIDEDYMLGEAVLELSGSQPAGSAIHVTFTLDKSGRLTITGTEGFNPNNTITAEMQAEGVMTEEQAEEIRTGVVSTEVN